MSIFTLNLFQPNYKQFGVVTMYLYELYNATGQYNVIFILIIVVVVVFFFKLNWRMIFVAFREKNSPYNSALLSNEKLKRRNQWVLLPS